MDNTSKLVVSIAVLALALLGVIFALNAAPHGPGTYDAFATCLGEKGAKFYGAFWCPHCQNQKRMFGSSVDLLPYVECSAPDAQSQLPICNEKKITGYPTWIFADGSRLSGEIPLETLSAKTGCPLPGAAASSSSAAANEASGTPASSFSAAPGTATGTPAGR